MILTSLNVVALLTSEMTRKHIEKVLARVSGVTLSIRMVGSENPLGQIGVGEMPDVVLVEINGHREQDIKDIEHILHEYSNRLTVFVTYQEGDIETMRRLMRAGVKDAFPQPIQTQELVMDITQAVSDKRARLQSAKGRKGGVVAFLNAKGGCGATTLAVNTAKYLAETSDSKVALIDFDIQFGTAAMHLDLHPTANVLDALVAHERIDQLFIDALMVEHESGLKVLPSPKGIASVSNISAESVTQLMEAAVEAYEFVILDMPRLFVPWTVAALKWADPLFVVIQNSLSTVIDAKAVIDALPLIELPAERVEFINNRAKSHMHSLEIGKLKEALEIPHIHMVRNDYGAAAKAQDRGVTIDEIAKRSPLTKDIHALAEYLIENHLGKSYSKKSHKLFSQWFHVGSD